MGRHVIQGETPHRCAINGNHRAATLVPVRRGSFVMSVCPACAEDEAALTRGFSQMRADLLAALKNR